MPIHVFLDESGDLSFDLKKSGVSQHFLIAILITKDPRPIERAVTKTIRWLKHRHPKHRGCLHAYQEDEATRRNLLERLAQLEWQGMVIELNKQKVYTKLQDEKAVLYNYVANILLDRLMSRGFLGTEKVVHLVAARRETNKFLNVNFRDYLRKQVETHHRIHLDVSIHSPHETKCLQAADLLSWSAFRYCEFGDESYVKIVKKNVQWSSLFPS